MRNLKSHINFARVIITLKISQSINPDNHLSGEKKKKEEKEKEKKNEDKRFGLKR